MKTAAKEIILYCDGSSLGNPGPSGAGIIITDPVGETLLEIGQFLGTLTNNEAEYRALTIGLDEALRFSPQKITVYMDSELVVRQMNGEYRVKKPELQVLHSIAKKKFRGFETARLTHVKRDRMSQADKLAKSAAGTYIENGKCFESQKGS